LIPSCARRIAKIHGFRTIADIMRSFNPFSGETYRVPTPQLFSDYLVRLMKFLDFAKKVVPLNDDIFDFFYEALPGYEQVGNRRILLGCWGAFQNPEVVDYTYNWRGCGRPRSPASSTSVT
jgi:hydrogenase large subunit